MYNYILCNSGIILREWALPAFSKEITDILRPRHKPRVDFRAERRFRPRPISGRVKPSLARVVEYCIAGFLLHLPHRNYFLCDRYT